MQGYTGQYCQSALNSLNACLQNPCGYNGTCVTTANSSYYCMCSNGLMGQSCSLSTSLSFEKKVKFQFFFLLFLDTVTSCSNSPCRYLSQCQQISSTNSISYQCICPAYLIGDRCQYTNNCQKQPCYNQGTCIPLGPQNNFMCLCQPGFGHYDCSICMLIEIF